VPIQLNFELDEIDNEGKIMLIVHKRNLGKVLRLLNKQHHNSVTIIGNGDWKRLILNKIENQQHMDTENQQPMNSCRTENISPMDIENQQPMNTPQKQKKSLLNLVKEFFTYKYRPASELEISQYKPI
jgi:hypothetical protein